jgi:hypothetical protein
MTVAPMVGPTARLANRGLMATGRAGERVAERVVPQIMERGGLPAEIMQGMSRGTVSPLDVWHGSPHRFPSTAKNPLGEFDASKIGTGEGAQMYGHGIYAAENQAVGKEYLKTEGMYKRVTGGMTNKEEFIADHLSQGRPEMNILDLYAQKYGGSFDDAMKDLINVKEMYGSGYLYKADLPDEQIAKMLDYDKTWKQQPQNVQDAINVDSLLKYYNTEDMPTSQVMYHAKQNMSPPAFAEFLRNKGIPGIKYFDEGSRAKGEGTRNFVVFPGEEKSMRILERNGETAASPFYQDPFMDTTR